ncbi:TetR/AcrR family transcriptional regulator [Ruminococcaceae bacterium OttesenSCG-928-I18]|nr:TetR/AcrR family transcriptional regulator [Ruminococcaceae bacterium OttesenSCG-928-I18]
MTNKDLKRKRIMAYFIEATIGIMDAEGVESITIRKVADAAGYNSATLYNYFNNLDHLITYASVSRLKDYIRELPRYINQANNAVDEYLAIWECFCNNAFAMPEVYYGLFFGKLNTSTSEIIKGYYEIFPAELEGMSRHLINMAVEGDIFQRNRKILEKCAVDGAIGMEEVDEINDITIYLFKGILSETLEKDLAWKATEQARKTMHYIMQIFSPYCLEDWINANQPSKKYPLHRFRK